MFLCQWSLDVQFGKLGEALEIIKEWGVEKRKARVFPNQPVELFTQVI